MNPSSCIVLNLVRRDKGEVLGGTTLYLFEKQGEEHILRQGHYKLRIYPREAEFPTDPGKCKTYAIPDYSTVASEFKKLGIVEQVPRGLHQIYCLAVLERVRRWIRGTRSISE